MTKYCNKCIVHCLNILVNTLTNVNKWRLIVKYYPINKHLPLSVGFSNKDIWVNVTDNFA